MRHKNEMKRKKKDESKWEMSSAIVTSHIRKKDFIIIIITVFIKWHTSKTALKMFNKISVKLLKRKPNWLNEHDYWLLTIDYCCIVVHCIGKMNIQLHLKPQQYINVEC